MSSEFVMKHLTSIPFNIFTLNTRFLKNSFFFWHCGYWREKNMFSFFLIMKVLEFSLCFLFSLWLPVNSWHNFMFSPQIMLPLGMIRLPSSFPSYSLLFLSIHSLSMQYIVQSPLNPPSSFLQPGWGNWAQETIKLAQGMKISCRSYSFVSLQTYCPPVLQMGKLRLRKQVADNFPWPQNSWDPHRCPPSWSACIMAHVCVLTCVFQGKERIHALLWWAMCWSSLYK